MKREDVERLRRKLVNRRREIIAEVDRLSDTARETLSPNGSGAYSHWPDHPADLATDAFEEQLTLGLIENESEELRAIDEALEKIRQGTYGICEGCDKPIALRRLRAIPYARLCIRCKRSEEARAHWKEEPS